MYAIETLGLTKQFGNVAAVDDLCLKVPEGSIYGFLGRNGSGKTTTFKMLTGLISPTSGEIKFYDSTVNHKDLKTRYDFGYLPDVPGFYGWMNAQEFLRFSGELFSIPKSSLDDRIEMLLALVGLEGVNKRISGYSRGMKQRLGIAQALIHDPKIVFLDEPVSALDPIGRKDVMDIIAKLSEKVTVLFSTHILSDVERICDRIAVIDNGKIQLEDSIVNIRRNYGVQALEIDLASGDISELRALLDKVEWVKNTSVADNGTLKVYVTDMEKAQVNLPGIIAEKRMALKKFSVAEGTLEEAFMKAVSADE